MAEKILVVGSSGQIGTELVEELRKKFGTENVVSSDIRMPQVEQSGPFEVLDILDKKKLIEVINKHQISDVYLLAAMLSANAEKKPELAWNLNMNSLLNTLNLAKEGHIKKVFWPSSIAVFGESTPRNNTPQQTIMEPSTIYGISKQAGERWCEYFYTNYNVDVRSVRYPGLIGYKSKPGGGTTDYAVDIFYHAVRDEHFECFLKEDTKLPMMYMSDAIDAAINIMERSSGDIKVRSSYNINGVSFSPAEISEEIRKIIPNFTISFSPDFRQNIADSWPQSIDDSQAKKDWNWAPNYTLRKLTETMIVNLKQVVKCENKF